MTHAHAGETAIYRLYDGTGQLLYLGLSNAPERRWEEHARDKWWWHLVTRKEVAWHPSREEAGRVEKASTATDLPRHDLVWRKATNKGRTWIPRPDDPFYEPLLRVLRQGLDDGAYPEGHVFRDDWDTANHFGVSVSTLHHALSTLEQDSRMRKHAPKDRSRVWTFVVVRGESAEWPVDPVRPEQP